MSDDRLSNAVRALREETAEPTDASQFTRARIMASVRETDRKRAGRVSVLIPIAAVLVVGSALATVSGAIPDMLDRLVSGTEQTPPEPSVPAPNAGKTAPAVEPAVVPESSIHVNEAPSEPEPEPEPEVRSTPAPVRASPTAATRPAPEVPPKEGVDARPAPPTEPADLTLYRAAHHKHFQEGDYAGAIAAYERYLAEEPRGRFVLEAAYNRALCLIRAGRTGEAATALQPFANGRYGAYRKHEAQRLLDAMGGRDAASPW